MAVRSVRLRELAAADIDLAVDHYLNEAGTEVALRFVDAIERTIDQIGRLPQSGTLR